MAERDDLGAVGGIELLHGADAGGSDQSVSGSAFWRAAALWHWLCPPPTAHHSESDDYGTHFSRLSPPPAPPNGLLTFIPGLHSSFDIPNSTFLRPVSVSHPTPTRLGTPRKPFPRKPTRPRPRNDIDERVTEKQFHKS